MATLMLAMLFPVTSESSWTERAVGRPGGLLWDPLSPMVCPMVCFGDRHRLSKCVLVARARVTEASHRQKIELILTYSSGKMSVFLLSRRQCAKVSIESKSVASVPALFLEVQTSSNCISTIPSSFPGYPAHHPQAIHHPQLCASICAHSDSSLTIGGSSLASDPRLSPSCACPTRL